MIPRDHVSEPVRRKRDVQLKTPFPRLYERPAVPSHLTERNANLKDLSPRPPSSATVVVNLPRGLMAQHLKTTQSPPFTPGHRPG